MKKSLKQIEESLAELKPLLKQKFNVEEIGVFGSYIRGEESQRSDLDVLVEFEKTANLSLLDFVRLENYLCDFLKVKVDLVEKGALKPRIKDYILKEVVYV